MAFQQEQSQVAERSAIGDVELTTTRVGSLVAGLAVVVQNTVWRVLDNNLPASIGEALDCLTGLALALALPPTDEHPKVVVIDVVDGDYLGSGLNTTKYRYPGYTRALAIWDLMDAINPLPSFAPD